MKIQTGKIKQHFAFGITLTNYHYNERKSEFWRLNGEYRSLIIDFAFWYIEFIFKDYEG